MFASTAPDRRHCYSATSMDAFRPPGGERDGLTIHDTMGVLDRHLADLVDRKALRPLILRYPDRERTILGAPILRGKDTIANRRTARHVTNARVATARSHPGAAALRTAHALSISVLLPLQHVCARRHQRLAGCRRRLGATVSWRSHTGTAPPAVAVTRVKKHAAAGRLKDEAENEATNEHPRHPTGRRRRRGRRCAGCGP
jgi:hypothetical protein